MFKINNKWAVLAGSIIVQLTIGSIYAWSMFEYALKKDGWNEMIAYLPYAVGIFFFAFSTIFSGKLVKTKGPRMVALIGAVLFGSGMILSSIIPSDSFLLVITFGVISGTGVGFVYVTPLSTLIKWFPTKKGLMTGLAVASFAFGSIFAKEIVQIFLDSTNQDPQAALRLTGLVYLVSGLIGAFLLVNPEGSDSASATTTGATPSEMVKTKDFYGAVFSYLFAVMPGLLVIGLAKSLGQDVLGLDASTAALAVTIIALFNASGRLVSGTLSDKFNTTVLLKVFSILTLVPMLILLFVELNTVIFFGSLGLIAFSYGSFLAIYPMYTNKKWGQAHYSANFGIIFQGYGFGAILGAVLKLLHLDYNYLFIASCITAVIAFSLTFLMSEKSEY